MGNVPIMTRENVKTLMRSNTVLNGVSPTDIPSTGAQHKYNGMAHPNRFDHPANGKHNKMLSHLPREKRKAYPASDVNDTDVQDGSVA
jgi:hypothetical protein